MKGDVKVIVSGETGRLVLDESSLIKRILMYVISAILGFGALFLAIMMDSRAYAATLPEIFMGTFEDAYTVGDPDEIDLCRFFQRSRIRPLLPKALFDRRKWTG